MKSFLDMTKVVIESLVSKAQSLEAQETQVAFLGYL